MHAVLRKQGVVGQLVGRIWKQLVHGLLAAKLVFRLLANAVAMAVHAFSQKTPDRQVHRVIRRHAIDTPDANFLLEQPGHHVRVRAGMAMDIFLLVGVFAELCELVKARV